MMRKLRKTTAVLTAAVLTMAMGMTAYAGQVTAPGGSESRIVTGNYVEGSGSQTVYKVDISWGSMSFTYTAAGEGSWNPETHTYSEGGSGSWTGIEEDTGKITVTNHSNAAVKATLGFEATSNFTAVEGVFTKNELTLADASKEESLNDPTKAPTDFSVLSLKGNPGGAFDYGAILGTVKVTISPDI